uniref:Medium-chain acyl-CoA ligase ACSF2, mitochondrial n=1 Tax=Panagrolaimus superbus TaxID=310955 RepID=A0A914XXF9_9BILA
MLIDILNHPDLPSTNISSLRGGIIGGAGTPGELCQKIYKNLGMQKYVNSFGSTETTMTAVSNPEDKNIVKPMYVMPHMEMAIINKCGKFVSRGEKGEIVVRGYSIMQGYWNDEEKTKEVFDKDRWFHTGDIGSMSSDGSIEISGRYKDVIVRGGFNYYPAEIEQFIVQHPFVADACVIGVPDKLHGEEVCAWIRLKSDTSLTVDELVEFLENRISTSKIPRYILFKLQHEFPLTPSGKIKKYELQKLSIKELKLEKVTSYCEK